MAQDLVKIIQQRQQNRMENLAAEIASRHGVKLPADDVASDDEDDWEGMSGDDAEKSDSGEEDGDDDIPDGITKRLLKKNSKKVVKTDSTLREEINKF